jgi:NTP pyrophosphatase (non-canonical NTP hydrolase)
MPDQADNTPLTAQEYQEKALAADRLPVANLAFPLLGLFGETGSLLSEAKKKHRDAASYTGYEATVVEELGDVLWYLTTVAARAGLSLAEIAHNRDKTFANWQTNSTIPLPFVALQPQGMHVQAQPSPAYEDTLLRLAGEVGMLVTDHQAGRLTDNRAAIAGHLIAILRTLIHAANEAGVSLEHAAKKNLFKIFDRWPQERVFPTLFDNTFPQYEKLPRDLVIEIFEREIGTKRFVIQRSNNINIGDQLTDNIMTPDDYRFHDVFHYAYAAVLGWSPVTRALFKLKRKSQPKIDEAEDGARATLIEEGIATWIFGQAKKLNYFQGMKPNDLSFDLLKNVRQFVSGYEPERCPLWLWEQAILEGYEAFRYLKEKRRARVHIDMHRRMLAVEELPA